MENKKDIGEVFKERFTDYAQSPNPKVWKAIEAKSGNNFTLNKTVIWAAVTILAAVAVGAGVIYILSFSSPTNTPTATEANQAQNTQSEQFPQNNIVADTNHYEPIKKDIDNGNFNFFKLIEKKLTTGSSIEKKETPYFFHVDSHQTVTQQKSQTIENKKTDPKERGKEKQQDRKDSSTGPLSKISRYDIQLTAKLPTLQGSLTQFQNIQETAPALLIENKAKSVENVSATPSNATDVSKDANNTAKPAKEEKLWIPNAFSPNDMTNSVFKASGSNIKKFEMVIYNQKGEQVFSSKDINQGWNGKIKGTNAPRGAYPYAVKYTTTAGTIHYQSGAVNLITE